MYNKILAIKQEIKANIKLSLPLITSQLLYSSSGFLSTLMIAKLGKMDLAASVLVSMVWFCLSVIFFSILSAVSVLVSHQHGAKNYHEVGIINIQAIYLATILIIIQITLLQCVPILIHLSKQPPVIYALANKYLYSMMYWIPALVFMIMFEQILIGLGKTRVVMILSCLLVPVQIAFIYCFTFGKLFFPATGIAGAGYGIAIADSFGLIFLIIYLCSAKQFKKYHLFANFKVCRKYLWELIRVGTPMGMMSFIEVSAFTAITFEIANFGTNELAAHRIILQYLGLFITIVFAMSQSVTVRVGHAVGQENKSGINYAIVVGMLINFCIIFVLACIMHFLPHWLIHFDISTTDPRNQLLVANTTKLFKICSFLLLFDNFRIIGFGALRGIKDTQFPMFASMLGFWIVGITCAYLFGFYMHMQDSGIWIGMTIGIASGMTITLARIFYKLRNLDLAKILAVKN